ncbi:MAG: phosphoribosylamine--glycine ligase [Nitrospina sp.]|jgi:phosphoribosylamine---glycine ligase|nr:phosphoribosylamine--glycine ligase [Nitrospina sp.]MBT3856078.1 phosphoribosylamine--glycine ligase [Nitrospina sp.]MBT4104407.1 phosphoribosylamine--glycine ligase [Nitrospina sp.]MBT4389924.1 phosphoribosylamine--glycine ligase [Nitrospina sp.]MBT4621979.1 phosphoribosylamine--glycine ligase [Nitrospina sp.]
MRVLVIGGGGREHALVWKISQSPKVTEVFCAPGNAGTATIATNVPIPADQIDQLLQFAEENEIGLTVVGPEQPLVMGIVDRFQEKGLRIFGPSARAAELEGSKAFSKNIMKKYGLLTAEYEIFTSHEKARKYFDEETGPIVVKASGLAAGKGVILCQNAQEGRDAVDTIMKDKSFGEAGDEVVIEEFLEGPEVSVLAFTDGNTVLLMDSAQDHKAALDGDKGPNTGGMGAYSPAPVFTDILRQKVRDKIMFPLVRAMKAEGRPYKGILYAGLMLTKHGPKILEFNARFGDPETQPLLVRMESDIVPLFEACVDGTLDQCDLQWKPESSVCVVMAAKGYPGSYEKGKEIFELDEAGALPDVVVFHAGTKLEDGKVLTNGGRVLGVTATGPDTASAIAKAYEAVGKIKWDGIHYRTDIGARDKK